MVKHKDFKFWIFILPGAFLGIIILGVALFQAFRNSLYRIIMYRLDEQVFVGMKNYITLWSDNLFLLSIRVTVLFTLGSTVFVIVFGLFIAGILSSKGIQGTGKVRVLMAFYLVPFVTTQIVVGVLGRLFIWEPEYGLINYLLGLIGVDGLGWLLSKETALLAVMISNAWRLIPLALLVFYAALATIPEELIEAAEVDGAKSLQIFLKIKLPMIKFHISFVTLLILTSAFREFDIIYSMTKGGPGRTTYVLSMLVYNRGIDASYMGVASAIAFSMFLIIAVLSLVYIKYIRLGELKS